MGPKGSIKTLLEASRLVFWDFDGVIKDSVDVKTTAYVELFRDYGHDFAERVKQHHQVNGGVSRFEKIPLYLGWANKSVTTEQIEAYCDRFSQHVFQAVIDAPWVPGVREYLLEHYAQQCFVLVTATPHEEAENILRALTISYCFRECHGVPTGKAATIRDVLQRLNCPHNKAVCVGDAETDYKAAQENNVTFLLRRTPFNLPLQTLHTGPAFDNLDQS